MASIDPSDPLGEARYWTTVRETLCRVFDADPDLAEQYRRRLLDAPAEERLLIYHNEPLDIAADLVGRAVTAADLEAYERGVLKPLLQHSSAGLAAWQAP